jgi:hypothetical protein
MQTASVRLYIDSRPSLESVIAREVPNGVSWITLDALAEAFRLRPDIMLRILQRWDLRYPARDISFTVCPPPFVLDGWCRRINQKYAFCRELIQGLDQYFLEAGALKETLRRLSQNYSEVNPVLDLEDLFDPRETNRLDDFIDKTRRSGLLGSAGLVDEDWVTFSRAGLTDMEDILGSFVPSQEVEGEVEINSEYLIWPGRPLPEPQPHFLGSRVVVVAASGRAKFGTFATVVGGSGARGEIELVADQVDPLFSHLGKKLSTRRGLTLKKGDVFALPPQGLVP